MQRTSGYHPAILQQRGAYHIEATCYSGGRVDRRIVCPCILHSGGCKGLLLQQVHWPISKLGPLSTRTCRLHLLRAGRLLPQGLLTRRNARATSHLATVRMLH
jgi:hypothetical protein